MNKRNYVFYSFMPVFLALSFVIIYYLVKTNYYTNSIAFWIGSISGIFVCIFLISAVILLRLSIAGANLGKKLKIIISIIILSVSSLAIIYFTGNYSLDSDVWWNGAIAGFLSCLLMASLILTIYIGYKLKELFNNKHKK